MGFWSDYLLAVKILKVLITASPGMFFTIFAHVLMNQFW